ncbi:accessory Sec system protein Asp2 [Rahnella inusitata]|uniref:Uncharacterized protein n=1 Tax=Rahnella inusitata TaxID=58169 RepID=A0ABX9P4H3_9GAMM|nr:accessory Sec system protein Asp2 [Rahnella inusitata]RJT15164.1 hypothetical protein D5396_06840 [Rahnella inusitata]
MSKIENKHYFKDYHVQYVFSPAKQDRKHLLVVFSGFGLDYDFYGATLDGCRSNILWIKDEFKGGNTYYLCVNQDFTIEEAVIDLINTTLEKLLLTEKQCTLSGFSKGGSAALYYGLKYNFSNILTSCPQIKIGSYLKNNWPSKVEHIFGKHSTNETVDFFDSLIPKLLETKDISQKNIYFITSIKDEQYPDQIKPFLSYYIKCNNFNIIDTNSTLAWQHNKITKYNIPIILSIIYAHGEGVFPHFGYVSNGIPEYNDITYQEELKTLQSRKEVVAKINKVKLDSSIFHLDGIGLIKGYECNSYEKIKHKVIFSSDTKSYEYPLGKILNEDLSYQFFESVFCDYTAAQVTSIGQKGIDISALSEGVYEVKCLIEVNKLSIIENFEFANNSNVQSTYDNKIISIFSKTGKIFISVNNLDKINEPKVFSVEQKWLRDGKLHYEGVYVIKGVEINNWGDAGYYIKFISDGCTIIKKIGLSHRESLNKCFSDHFGLYSKAYYSTIGNEGIYINDLPDGIYKIKIILNKQGLIFEEDTGDLLEIKNNNYAIK